MKKDISKEVPVDTEQSATNVRSYFTKEINEKIAEMSTKQMEAVMKEMATTPYWIAILKYVRMRMPFLDATLRGTDPSKDPSKISWAQGAMAGICDIESYVIDLNSPAPIEEPAGGENVQPKTEGVIIG